MEKTVTLEGAKLKGIADKNETAQLVLFSLADRKRFRAVTDISHMKNNLIRRGEKIVAEDYMDTWKALQSLGVGSIIWGRNGQSHRFKWNYSLTSIGNAAMTGKDVEVKQLKTIAVRPTTPPKKRNKPSIKSLKIKESPSKGDDAPDYTKDESMNILYIPLRSNYIFNAKIPKLSKFEADMICDAIQRCI